MFAKPSHGSRQTERQPVYQRNRWKKIWLAGVLLLYLGMASYNLGLPGLHYDEAKEAGVNAVELLTGEPLTPFRDASLRLLGVELPLMVQDYIGAINVFLAYPFLKFSGIGVPNLRFLSLLLGLLALLTLERAVSAWVWISSTNHSDPRRGEKPEPHLQAPRPSTGIEGSDDNAHNRVPISMAGLIAVALLAASPSFVFWSRQGIFVTNVIQPLCFGSIWMGFIWLRTRQATFLLLSGVLAGLALYGKLLAIWVVFPFLILLVICTWLLNTKGGGTYARFWGPWAAFGVAASLPLIPLVLFNLQTQGTMTALFSNATESYYGVDNSALAQNLEARFGQIVDVLRGNHFWYLGGTYANGMAPWLTLIATIIGLVFGRRQILPWMLCIGAAFLLSLFTISDLFITHYALLHPLIAGLVGLGLASAIDPVISSSSSHRDPPKSTVEPEEGETPTIVSRQKSLRVAIVGALVILWLGLDLGATLQYHGALNRSGGLADHSDASYKLAFHLRYNGLGAPILLDWGMDAPVRYLSEGTVRPVEIFGYDSPAEPDADLPNRIGLFINNPDNVYLLHSPDATVFEGRREVFFAEVEANGFQATLEETFAQRDGTPLFELWRVIHP